VNEQIHALQQGILQITVILYRPRYTIFHFF